MNKTNYCTKCETIKPLSEFHKASRKKSGVSSWCKRCNADAHQARKKADPDYVMRRHFKTRYGLSLEDVILMIEEQNHECVICGTEVSLGDNAHVDHNHDTGDVRGVLCNNCNWMLGHSKDNPEVLEKGAKYIREHLVQTRIGVLPYGM